MPSFGIPIFVCSMTLYPKHRACNSAARFDGRYIGHWTV
jgi:hypothetical protein